MSTGRPLIITQSGRSSAVILDVCEYEELMEKLELLQDIHESEQEINQGKGLAHDKARALLK